MGHVKSMSKPFFLIRWEVIKVNKANQIPAVKVQLRVDNHMAEIQVWPSNSSKLSSSPAAWLCLTSSTRSCQHSRFCQLRWYSPPTRCSTSSIRSCRYRQQHGHAQGLQHGHAQGLFSHACLCRLVVSSLCFSLQLSSSAVSTVISGSSKEDHKLEASLMGEHEILIGEQTLWHNSCTIVVGFCLNLKGQEIQRPAHIAT